MVASLGLWISRVFRRTAPDPFVIAILLTLLVTGAGLIGIGEPAGSPRTLAERGSVLFARWSSGFWDLLKFAMQMTLVLVTGHALAASAPVARAIRGLSGVPRSGPMAAAVVCLVASLAGLVNWGLGLIVGAVLARETGRALAARGVASHYPLLAAAGYMGLLVFHGGLSGSAPLTMSTVAGVKSVIPDSALAKEGGAIALDRTLGSSLNLLVTGGMVVWLAIVFWMLHPKGWEKVAPLPAALAKGSDDLGASQVAEDDPPGRIPDWLERTKWLPLVFGSCLLGGFVVYLRQAGWTKLTIDHVNMLMFGLGLIMHGSLRAYASASEEAARGSAGVIVQFPIYAGIMALMAAGGLTQWLADGLTRAATPGTLGVWTFVSATLVGLFVPSGGAQWSIQGPIALESARRLGVDDGTVLMAVAFGDEVANMLQPFWALPLLAITGVKAREIVGYTAIVMVLAIGWMGGVLWWFGAG